MKTDRNPEYFLTVAEEQSISKAAERLHISQPYLSQYLIRLENALQVKLLDRSKVPLRLTEAGKLYRLYLKNQDRLLEQLRIDFANLSSETEQTLRIAMSNWRSNTILPDVLPVFTRENPNIRLDLHEQPTSEMMKLVEDGVVDFSVLNINSTTENVTTETLLYEKILLVGNRNNPTTRQLICDSREDRICNLSLLEHERIVLLRPELTLAKRVNNYLSIKQISLQDFMYSTNTTTALSLTAGNYGFCFVNETAIRTAPNRNQLAFFDLGSDDLIHPLCVVYKKGTDLSLAGRSFIDITAQFYRAARNKKYEKQIYRFRP